MHCQTVKTVIVDYVFKVK